MKTGFFHDYVLKELRAHLERGDVSVARVKTVSKEALAVSDRHEPDIPHDAVLSFVSEYPEIRSGLMTVLKEEETVAQEATIAELRKRLKSSS